GAPSPLFLEGTRRRSGHAKTAQPHGGLSYNSNTCALLVARHRAEGSGFNLRQTGRLKPAAIESSPGPTCMRWDQTEYVLKGVYLGLLLAVALHGPSWTDVALVAVCTGGGLAVSLAWAGWNRIRSGVPARGHVAGFLLFLLLENPRAVFTGLLAGLAGGAYLVI